VVGLPTRKSSVNPLTTTRPVHFICPLFAYTMLNATEAHRPS
jgi:hypothetical protein